MKIERVDQAGVQNYALGVAMRVNNCSNSPFNRFLLKKRGFVFYFCFTVRILNLKSRNKKIEEESQDNQDEYGCKNAS